MGSLDYGHHGDGSCLRKMGLASKALCKGPIGVSLSFSSSGAILPEASTAFPGAVSSSQPPQLTMSLFFLARALPGDLALLPIRCPGHSMKLSDLGLNPGTVIP